MADILIRGMEIPTNRDVTIRIDPNGEVYVYGTYPTMLLRAVTLPEGYGRLIDADALRKEFQEPENWNDFAQTVYHITGIWATIDTAPTIVPAEGGSANV